MADVSDPAIAEAYQNIRKDATGINWYHPLERLIQEREREREADRLTSSRRVVLGYTSPTKIGVQGQGTGGVEEAVSHLKDDECQYGMLKVEYQGDDETRRTKFVFFSWAGPKVSALKKGKMSVHKAAVKSIFADFSVEIHATSREELAADAVLDRIRKANY
jgi:hypothetical protein